MDKNKYKNMWRKLNPDKVKKENYRSNMKSREKIRCILIDLKVNGCSICGYDKNWKALDFHHVNFKNKKFNVNFTELQKPYTNLQIIKELNKCVLVCANCHRGL